MANINSIVDYNAKLMLLYEKYKAEQYQKNIYIINVVQSLEMFAVAYNQK